MSRGRLIRSHWLIDGTGSPPVEDGCLLVRDGTVERVGPARELGTPPKDTDVVDFGGHCILPGLIDSHSHLSIVPAEGDQLGQLRLPPAVSVLRSIPNLYRNLRSGVTTQRIMGQEHWFDVDVKRAIQDGLVQGPRLLVSGIGLVASNGHGVGLTTADGVDEVRKLARRNLARGVDLIKIFMTGGVSSAGTSLDFCGYTAGEVAAAVEEADRAGRYVAAHAHGGRGVDLCIEHGVRSLEHAAFLSAGQLERVLARQMWIVGTFSILYHPQGIEKTDFHVPAIREKVLRARDSVAQNFARILASGANLAVGTDSMHGFIAYELECLTRFGASPMQAIVAATGAAARACRVEDRLGTLEPGKIADFIAVAGNPLDDIRALGRVEAVFKGGEKVDLPSA